MQQSPHAAIWLIRPLFLTLGVALICCSCVGSIAVTQVPGDAPADAAQWVRERIVRVRSINPEDNDLSDLLPLRKSLSGTRVVLLGEASHSDGSAFLAKTRLIKFLHQEMGFDLLVFESGFYDCAKAWPPAREATAASAFEQCAWALWSQRQELDPLVAYLEQRRSAAAPLVLAGLDPDTGSLPMNGRRSSELRVVVEALPSPGMDPQQIRAFFEILDRLADYRTRALPLPAPPTLEAFVATAARLADVVEAAGQLPAVDRTFWSRVLHGISAETRARFIAQMYAAKPPDPQAAWAATLERDQEMARNLFWLLDQRYPGRKAIVWAATIHAARALHHVGLRDAIAAEPTPYGFSMQELFRRRRVMGDVLWDRLGKQMYSIAFTAYEDALPQGNSSSAAPAGSLEDLIHGTGAEYAFLDIRSSSAMPTLVARPFTADSESADWRTVVDAFFFVRTRQQSTRRPAK